MHCAELKAVNPLAMLVGVGFATLALPNEGKDFALELDRPDSCFMRQAPPVTWRQETNMVMSQPGPDATPDQRHDPHNEINHQDGRERGEPSCEHSDQIAGTQVERPFYPGGGEPINPRFKEPKRQGR